MPPSIVAFLALIGLLVTQIPAKAALIDIQELSIVHLELSSYHLEGDDLYTPWKIKTGKGEGVYKHELQAPSMVRLLEGSSYVASGAAVKIPNKLDSATFLFSIRTSGEDDALVWNWGSHLLWSAPGRAFRQNALYAANFDVSEFQGESAVLTAGLIGQGLQQAEFWVGSSLFEAAPSSMGIVTEVPEPSTHAMLATGLLMVGLRLLSKTKAKRR